MLDCWRPMLVIRYLPSAVIAVPSCSVGPNVICWGVPSGYLWRQMWNAPPAFDEKYIHRPSFDHAALVHCASGGLTGRPGDEPLAGTSRHGTHVPPFISTTSSDLPS